MPEEQQKRRGPKPERVKIDEDWEDAIDKALRKEKPAGGWPKHDGTEGGEAESDESEPDESNE